MAAEFTAPQLPSHSSGVAAQPIASALGLAASDLIITSGLPRAASCGVPFLLVELASTEALGRAMLHDERILEAAEAKGVSPVRERVGEAPVSRPHVRSRRRHRRGSATGSAAAGLPATWVGGPAWPRAGTAGNPPGRGNGPGEPYRDLGETPGREGRGSPRRGHRGARDGGNARDRRVTVAGEPPSNMGPAHPHAKRGAEAGGERRRPRAPTPTCA